MKKENMTAKKCAECSKLFYCLNGTVTGTGNSDCFKKPKCSECSVRLYCTNQTGIIIDADDGCFKEPECRECPVGTHCKNCNLPGVQFGLNKGSPTPTCFSKFHSIK